MKKLLLLGGSAQQVIAIESAKRLGYSTILCDYLPDNPGQYKADKFFLVSTTDKEEILEIAKKENIDGVVAYASDPAAPTAAYVAEKLGLPGNPYESVEILCNKNKFRRFLTSNGFFTPTARGYTDIKTAEHDITSGVFRFPIIIKPEDSSGSKGATVLEDGKTIQPAIEFAFSFSRSKRIIVEEYIVKKHPYLIGGDIFVADGKVIMWGIMNCHRDNAVNPLVPVGKSYPLMLGEKETAAVHATLQTMVDKLNIKNCPMNVELIVDEKGRVFLIDIGPRSGGNMIPDLLGMIFDADVVEMSVKVAMDEKIDATISAGKPFYATHNLHSNRTGVFQDIKFSHEIEKHIIKKCIYKKPGEKVEFFDNASKALGIVFLKFDNEKQLHEALGNINQHINIVLEA